MTRALLVFLEFLLLTALIGCAGKTVRFATYNASLFRETQGELVEDLGTPGDEQAQAVAAVIQTVRPDVLLVNEFDWDAEGKAADLFRANYLQVSQAGLEPITYPYVYVAQSNTGVPSGFDLDNDGKVGGELGTRDYGNDALGYGTFLGQYSFILLSKYPIDTANVRTFGDLLWKDLPENRIPPGFYSDEELAVLPLSSKNHADIPVQIDGKTAHVLASHPTPPGFDGDEDRNGRRNADEIGLILKMLPTESFEGVWHGPDGETRRLPPADPFLVMGDLNADPVDGGSVPGAIQQLLDHPRVQDSRPWSEGGVAAAFRERGANLDQTGNPAYDTGDFDDHSVGNLRTDYVLPSVDPKVKATGIYWPTDGPDLERVEKASDHHMVWVDVMVK